MLARLIWRELRIRPKSQWTPTLALICPVVSLILEGAQDNAMKLCKRKNLFLKQAQTEVIDLFCLKITAEY